MIIEAPKLDIFNFDLQLLRVEIGQVTFSGAYGLACIGPGCRAENSVIRNRIKNLVFG